MSAVLAVDGGNSKTVALIGRADGTIEGQGRGGCSDIYGAPSVAAAFRAIDEAVDQALHMAGIDAAELDLGLFSMAGVDWPEDEAFLRAEMARRGYGRQIVVMNDALGALRSGSDDWTGVAVVCGTGAAVGARNPKGSRWHTGWWQEPQGSRHLAQKALRAVYRADLSIDPATSLTGRVLEIFSQPDVEGVLHLFTSRVDDQPYHRLPHVTRALLEEADHGDATAHRIVSEHGASLGDYAAAAARRVGIERTRFPLVLAGGVLRHQSVLFADAIAERVKESSPEVEVVHSQFEPAVGAVLLAMEFAGTTIDAGVLRRLRESIPPPGWFET